VQVAVYHALDSSSIGSSKSTSRISPVDADVKRWPVATTIPDAHFPLYNLTLILLSPNLHLNDFLNFRKVTF